jgi:hypothetical protein
MMGESNQQRGLIMKDNVMSMLKDYISSVDYDAWDVVIEDYESHSDKINYYYNCENSVDIRVERSGSVSLLELLVFVYEDLGNNR